MKFDGNSMLLLFWVEGREKPPSNDEARNMKIYLPLRYFPKIKNKEGAEGISAPRAKQRVTPNIFCRINA